jgi:hypothetical protein
VKVEFVFATQPHAPEARELAGLSAISVLEAMNPRSFHMNRGKAIAVTDLEGWGWRVNLNKRLDSGHSGLKIPMADVFQKMSMDLRMPGVFPVVARLAAPV